MARVRFYSDGPDGVEARTLAAARAFDRGDAVPSTASITFNSAAEMVRFITPNRIILLEMLSAAGLASVKLLARKTGRTEASVARDLNALEKIGAVTTATVSSSGNKKALVVKPLASRYDFACTIPGPRAPRRAA